MLSMSPDGYIRLPFTDFISLPFVHVFSESDTEFLEELRAQTVPAVLAGFSEWRSTTNPSVSLGWGWFIHHQSGQMLLAPDGVRSNLMFRDIRGYDLGSARTMELLSTWLSIFEWQDTVSRSLLEDVTC